MSSHIHTYISQLFENGLEGYDKTQKDGPSRGVTNPGGAKIFFHLNWRTGQSPVVIQNEAMNKVVRELNVLVGTVNRIQLDDAKNPVKVPNSDAYNRTHSGLILYPNNDANPALSIALTKRIIEAVNKEAGIDISDYIASGSELIKAGLDINVVSQVQHMNFARVLVPIKPEACIFVALPSGAPGSAQFWTYQNNKRSRSAIAATSVDSSDLPI